MKCLDDYGEGTCEGSVEFRHPLSGTGRSFARCDKHWEERLVDQEKINARYPYSRPSDFSELDAGERWDDEY